MDKLGYDYTTIASMQYLGKDRKHNYYWRFGTKTIFIFDNVVVIDVFQYDRKKSRCTPTIHPSDVYFLDYDDKQVYLYRIRPIIIDIVDNIDIIIEK